MSASNYFQILNISYFPELEVLKDLRLIQEKQEVVISQLVGGSPRASLDRLGGVSRASLDPHTAALLVLHVLASHARQVRRPSKPFSGLFQYQL